MIEKIMHTTARYRYTLLHVCVKLARAHACARAHTHFLAHIYIHIMEGSHNELEDSLVYIASPGQPEQHNETLPQRKRHRQQSRQNN